MKHVYTAFTAALLLLVCGCVTEVRTIPLTGDITVDAPRAIAEGPPRDRALWDYRLAAASMRTGNFDVAKKSLDDALLTVGGIFGKDINAAKSRHLFQQESRKTFVGEPYERVMAYYYRGILYWMDGELDNARACFRSGEFEDRSSLGPEYNGDYVILDYLDGLATTKLNGDGSDAFHRALMDCKKFPQPPPYDKNANVDFFLEFGQGPIKARAGEYGEELAFNVPESATHSATIIVDGREQLRVYPYDDLGFQATTRGVRVVDKILENKANIKSATDAAGNGAIVGGVIAASSGTQTGGEVGLGLIAAGLISKVVSASTKPQADVRAWDNLPRFLSFASLSMTPGAHEVTIEYQDRFGSPAPGFTKHFTVNIPADRRDKAVFVSDISVTPPKLMKHSSLTLPFATLALGSLLLAGCQSVTHETGAYIPVNTTINDVENHEPVVLLDSRVQYSLTCSGIRQAILPDGRLDLFVNLRNREGRRIQVQANCVFKDEMGFPTEGGDAPFQNVILSENAQESVHFTALNSLARKYTIRIREAR